MRRGVGRHNRRSLVGYLSDRTSSRWGRRRPWMLLASLPLAGFFIMLWNPPSNLGEFWSISWMVVAVFGFFTATTAFVIPHTALGAELSKRSTDRTRLFAGRHVGVGIGLVLAGAGMAILREAEDQRLVAMWLSLSIGVATALWILLAVPRLPERREYLDRGAENPLRAYLDVWRNPHARVVLSVQFISSLGGATLMVLATFYLDYVVRRPDLLLPFFATYFVPAYMLVPLWVPVAAAAAASNISRLAVAMGERLIDLDVNPLIVGVQGAIAVDGRATLTIIKGDSHD